MVWYAPDGFAAGISSLLQPLFTVQPVRSRQSASTLSCIRSRRAMADAVLMPAF
jgi:hypothetical protein